MPTDEKPPLTVTVPSFENRTPLIKRMAIFSLVLLVLYYSVISFVQSRDNHQLLDSQSKSIGNLTDGLDRALDDLAQARNERAALIRIAIAQNAEIKRLGGNPVDIFTPGVDTNGNGVVDPNEMIVSGSGTASPTPQPTPSPRPSPTPAPRPSATPTRSPSPSPSPTQSPTPMPLVCVNAPLLGRVCTP